MKIKIINLNCHVTKNLDNVDEVLSNKENGQLCVKVKFDDGHSEKYKNSIAITGSIVTGD